MIPVVEHAIKIVSEQTRRIRRRLRKNRSRIVYCVQNDEGYTRHCYRLRTAIRLAKTHPDCWIYQGLQNARWINCDNLTGCKWSKTRVFRVNGHFNEEKSS